jgi:HTH-type transcriptional regulator / antitoxin HipB
MGWRSLLLTPEVRAWLAALGDDDFGRVAFHLDLLRQRQGQLEAPHSRCLRGRLRRLEIPGGRRVHRLAYYVDGDGTIVLLTSGDAGVAATTSADGPRPRYAADAAQRQQDRRKGAVMSRRDRWEELRQDRLASPAASAGYERARRAFELGEQLRALREAQHLSQAELARRMGSTQPAIARLEAGRVAPSLNTLDRAAAALGVELVISFQKPQRRDRRQLSG